ncbi:MAG: tyrosine-protein phosphatase [Bacteroidales bacterium]
MKKNYSLMYLLAALALSALVSCSDDDKSGDEYKVYENHISLEGEDNLRDLGGYVGQDGKRVLYRKLFRSGELSALTESDKTTLSDIGIEQVFDLRSEVESKDQADNLPTSVELIHFPLSGDASGNEGGDSELSYEEQMKLFMQKLASGEISVDDVMAKTYIADSLKVAQWRKIFDKLETGKASLWHCTAGKDRAGMTTLLILSSLGVSEESCIDDFLKSNDYLADYIKTYKAQLTEAYGTEAAEAIIPLMGVKRSWIEAFIKDVKTKYGSIAAFLEELGVDTIQMQENYLER